MHTHVPDELHTWPVGQSVPRPHEGPPEQTLAMVAPQVTVAGSVVGHAGTHWHTPPVHAWPEGQRVPVPHEGPPAQVLGMAAPQS